jgi:hypothetical protein
VKRSESKPSSTCLYLVVESRGAWWIDREAKAFGPCDTRDEAISSAFRLIKLFGDPTRPLEVWATADSGRMELIWKGKADDASASDVAVDEP